MRDLIGEINCGSLFALVRVKFYSRAVLLTNIRETIFSIPIFSVFASFWLSFCHLHLFYAHCSFRHRHNCTN